IPSPVLNSVPRPFACSQSGPRCFLRISPFASNPPHASTTARALISSPPARETPLIAASPPLSRPVAPHPYRTSTPASSVSSNSRSDSPAPPPTASMTSPPQNRRLPSTSNACRPYKSTQRTPCSRIRSEEHTSELQSLRHLVCRLLLEKK